MKLALSNFLQIACIVFNVYKSMDSFCKHIFPLINMYKTILVGVYRGAHPPPPPALPSWDDLRLSDTTGILQNMEICMICILSSSHHIIRDLKQRRRRRQQQRQKSDWFYEQNNCSARASRFLVHFFDVYCTNTTWKPLNATIYRRGGHTTTNFLFSIWTWINP